MLNQIQSALEKVWTDELYSTEFKGRDSCYKHFDHALKHVRKAAQALENMTEEADHGRGIFEHLQIKKYVADIIISAIRLANVSPTLNFKVQEAVLDRLALKMNVVIKEPVQYKKFTKRKRTKR